MIEINCPNCGAPIDLTKDKCPYCETPYPKEIPLDGEEASHVLRSLLPFGKVNKNFEVISEDCDITIPENFAIKIPRIVSPETFSAEMKFLTPNEHRAIHGLPPIVKAARMNGKSQQAFERLKKGLTKERR